MNILKLWEALNNWQYCVINVKITKKLNCLINKSLTRLRLSKKSSECYDFQSVLHLSGAVFLDTVTSYDIYIYKNMSYRF